MPTIAAFTCTVFDLTLHAIADLEKREPLHLSFSRQHHDRALQWLQRRGMAPSIASPLQGRPYCAGLIEQWLAGGSPSMPPASPFFAAGTEFQRRVWLLISAVPFGRTATYGELARQLGNIRLSRAVGQACNANPLALHIPCHRVVGAKDTGGFAGGSAVKQRLLALERQRA